jgi:AbrB family looped-hinge helix DNA binding protein
MVLNKHVTAKTKVSTKGRMQKRRKMSLTKHDTAKTRVSTKGQVILPKAIRDKHKWKPGTELNVEETPDGVLLRPARYFAPTKLEDVAGMLRHKVHIDHPLSVEEMDAAIVAEARRRARD